MLNNDDVVKLCLKKMEKGTPPEQICEEIMDECLSPDLLMTGTDNMTIVLICFLHKKSYEDFCKRAAEYCQRFSPSVDDEKLQHEKSVEHQFPECENGLSSIVIPQQDNEDDSSSNSDEDQPKKNGPDKIDSDVSD